MLETEGQFDESLAQLKLSTEIDPLSAINASNYGATLSHAGCFSEAIQVIDRALALQPGFPQLLSRKAEALLDVGRMEEAVALVRQMEDGDLNDRLARIRMLTATGSKDGARALLADSPAQIHGPPSAALLALGQREEPPALLDTRSFSVNGTSSLMGSTYYDSIRGEPRFAQFIAEIGLTKAHGRAQAWRKAHPPEKPTFK